MGAPLHSQLLLLFLCSLSLLLLSFKVQLTYAMSTITAMAKDQIACTMCSSCDNPCQPILSPPPPSPPLPCPPPPSPSPPLPPPLPPASSDYNSPPPPSPSSSCPGDCSQPLWPPYNGGGGGGGDGNYFYPPTNPSIYPTPPPPNPIVPYFPFYYYNPPPPSTLISKSIQFQNHPFITCLILAMAIFLLL